jgi:hypothetical protein
VVVCLFGGGLGVGGGVGGAGAACLVWVVVGGGLMLVGESVGYARHEKSSGSARSSSDTRQKAPPADSS